MKVSPVNNFFDLSIIILNYNSGDYLLKCLESLETSNLKKYICQVIVIDNQSTDDSFQLAKKQFKSQKFHTIFHPLSKNLGFATGNNQGIKKLSSNTKYVLFLNPDTLVEKDTISHMISLLNKDKNIDAATCAITLALTNQLQPECHRGFPTPWRSICYFSGLSSLFPKSKYFNGYFLGHLNKNKLHQIEACVGAFLMVKKSVGDAIGWWNEKYFFYGEDLDFCYKLSKNGYKLYFDPNCQITHFQGVSSGIKKQSKDITRASRETKIRSALASTNAMRIFYQENLISSYPKFIQALVMSGIKIMEMVRVFKARYL